MFVLEAYQSGRNEPHSKCGCRSDSARGFESLRFRQMPCFSRFFFGGILHPKGFVLSARPKMWNIFSRFVLKICHRHISFTQSPLRFRKKKFWQSSGLFLFLFIFNIHFPSKTLFHHKTKFLLFLSRSKILNL